MSTSFWRIALCVYFNVMLVEFITSKQTGASHLPSLCSVCWLFLYCSTPTWPKELMYFHVFACAHLLISRRYVFVIFYTMCVWMDVMHFLSDDWRVTSSAYGMMAVDLSKRSGWGHKHELIVSRAEQQMPVIR